MATKLRKHAGFTLIELMVGMVVGLLTTIVIAQMLSLAEGQRRAATSGTDAQVNGALALYTLQRDLQMAGYGISDPDAFGCTINAQYSGGSALTMTMAPAIITDGGTAGDPDTITILSSNKTNASVPLLVTEVHTQSATNFVVQSALMAATGDIMVAVPKSWDSTSTCTLFNVTSTTTTTVVHASTGAWNATLSALMPSAGYVAKSYLINFGNLVYRTYSINSSHMLQAADLSSSAGTTTTTESYPEIVNLQALYAVDSDGDGVIDAFTTTTPTTAVGWQRVLGIRVAVLARSSQYEKNVVTTTAPTWSVRMNATDTADTTLTLRVDQLTDWQHYRYRVYDTMVPLRNVLWNS
jgi:type IV pilus assembly protein PilW